MTNRTRFFSLIELLIVVGILGALAGLIMPAFNGVDEDAKDKVAFTEMKEIQRQFQQFYADVIHEMKIRNKVTAGGEGNTVESVTNYYLQDIALYGIWPLLVPNHPSRTEQTTWPTDAGTNPKSAFRRYEQYGTVADGEVLDFGWHGPYLEYEGIVAIENPVLEYQYDNTRGPEKPVKKGGQTRLAANGTGTPVQPENEIRIPVLKDPYGGYYRVLCPEARTTDGNNKNEYDRLKRMVIVCTGRNRKLDTQTSSFIPSTDREYVKAINGDDLKAQGDDIVIRLLPTAF